MARRSEQVFVAILVAYDGSPQAQKAPDLAFSLPKSRVPIAVTVSFVPESRPASGSEHWLPAEAGTASIWLALSPWSEQIVRKLEILVNSYADAYRVQVRRISGASDTAANVGQLRSDLDLLKNWNAARTGEFEEKRA
jgi:hypothetical protein